MRERGIAHKSIFGHNPQSAKKREKNRMEENGSGDCDLIMIEEEIPLSCPIQNPRSESEHKIKINFRT
jgi:hypothetical protein